MVIFKFILFIISQIIETLAIIYFANTLYDFFFKGGHKNEDNND